MEEEIKILEELIEDNKKYFKKPFNKDDEDIQNILKRQNKALENLLTRYKQIQLTDKEKEVVKAYRNLVKHTGSDSWVVCDPMQMWSNYFIPKSKVKEKIEELDNKRRKFTSDNVNNFYLQEFTRKYTQKSDHDYGVFSTPETIIYCTNNELLGRVEVLQELLREE